MSREAFHIMGKIVTGTATARDRERLEHLTASKAWGLKKRTVADLCRGKPPGPSRRARIAELEEAIDEKEVASGLTSNGNLWRFWSTKASALAVRNAELEKRLADAERVIKPFAEAVSKADATADRMGLARSFDEYAHEWTFTFGQLRAARAYMEGK